mmetsp:Transcript_17297/g.31329  ORF Transcript_17297/g.31329 Transcript_17297/m.31329 type:complete len:754 (-) Transcript_17297:132-2393(-)
MKNCTIAADGNTICYVKTGRSFFRLLCHDIFLVAITIIATCIAIAAYNYYIYYQERSKKKHGNASENEWLLESNQPQKLTDLPSKSMSIAASLAHIEGGMEASGNFLSAIFSQMWHHTNIAVSNTIKDTLAPTLKDLKVPLHFVKLDLGDVPIRTTNMLIHRVDLESSNDGANTKQTGIQIDVDVEWDGNCDIMIQATLTKSAKVIFGVKAIKLSGRMHILLSPLTTELPVISAVQYGFTNPPNIQLEFTGAVKTVTSLSFVQSALVGVIQSSLASMLVLPNRMVMPIDLGSYDYLDTYQPPVGMIRLTAVSGRGFKVAKKVRLLKDVPDVYCKISLGASKAVRPPFRTSTKKNNLTPSWRDESGDFILYDMDQKIYVEVFDEDKGPLDPDDELGEARISVRDLFRNDGICELELELEGKDKTGCYITLSAELFHLSEQLQSLSSFTYEGKNQLCGLATIIVTKAFDIPVPKVDAATFVKVVYGESSKHEKTFYTGTVMDYPGYDALNPMYDSVFHVPITSAMLQRDNGIVFTLIDGEGANGTTGHGELGKMTVTHESLLRAYKHTMTETRLIGNGGAKLEFRVILSGMQSETEKMQLASVGSNRVDSPQDDKKSFYGGIAESNTNIRVTALRGRGFKIQKRRIGKKDDVPDVYCNIRLISQQLERPFTWKTPTIKDDTMPQWNESKEFSNINPSSDFVCVDVYEENSKGKDEWLGIAEFSLEKLLRKRLLEMELRNGSTLTKSYVTLVCIRL